MTARLVKMRQAHQIFELLGQGANVLEIAQVLDLPESKVRTMIATYERNLEVSVQEKAAIHREVHLGRLETLLNAVWPAATQQREDPFTGAKKGPSMAAVDRALKILAHERALLGLNAPLKTEVTAEVQVSGGIDLSTLSVRELEEVEATLLKVVNGGA